MRTDAPDGSAFEQCLTEDGSERLLSGIVLAMGAYLWPIGSVLGMLELREAAGQCDDLRND